MKEYRNKLDNLLADHRLHLRMVKTEKISHKKAKEKVEALTQAQQIVQSVAEQVQTQAHGKIVAIVDRCLSTVFGKEAYQFRINFVKSRGKTEAKLLFVKDGEELDPKLAVGGGTVDVAAFALRLTDLLLAKPRRRLLLCLDETLKFLHGEEYQERMANVCETLAKEFGVQMVIASDESWLQIGKEISL